MSLVSAVTSYSSPYQYQYFGTTVSNERLKTLMERYGITQTGDSSDIQALYEAMYSEASSEVDSANAYQYRQELASSQAAQAAASTNIPWASLMSRVGLTATGDLETDYEKFSTKIFEMQASGAASQQDQAYISQLISQASVVFVQSSEPQSQTSPQAQMPSDLTTGAEIQSLLNKMYIL